MREAQAAGRVQPVAPDGRLGVVFEDVPRRALHATDHGLGRAGWPTSAS
ncbi:MAG TPA: hypothetical protein VFJ85_15325 [Acidimicrobiales bacterium]|nr:hypothetical protein [Acidimicrobiales bacterium]